jgi:hypothetical protein
MNSPSLKLEQANSHIRHPVQFLALIANTLAIDRISLFSRR